MFSVAFFFLPFLLLLKGTTGTLSETSQLDCDTNKFTVTIDYDTIQQGVVANETQWILYVGNVDKCNYTGENNDYIYLNDNGTKYVFDIPFDECDVVRSFTGDFLNYDVSLERVEYYEDPADTPMISRMKRLQLDVSCMIKTSGYVVSTSYQASDEPIFDNIAEETTLALTTEVYKFDQYGAKYYSYPIRVNEGKYLYYQIQQSGVGVDGIELSAEHCTLANSTNLNDVDTLGYPMLIDGCPDDAAFELIDPPQPDMIRFSFPTLRFAGETDDTYYVVCSVFVCDVDDINSQCKRDKNCSATAPNDITGINENNREKRDNDNEATIQQPVFPYKSRERVVIGRIILLESTGDGAGAEDLVDQLDDDGTTAIGAGAAGGAATGVVVAAAGASDRCTT